jgi:hypothetical protein
MRGSSFSRFCVLRFWHVLSSSLVKSWFRFRHCLHPRRLKMEAAGSSETLSNKLHHITSHHRGPQSLTPCSRVPPSGNVVLQLIKNYHLLRNQKVFPCLKEDVVVPQHKTKHSHTCSSNILLMRVRIFAKGAYYLHHFRPFVRLSKCTNAAPTGGIFLKFYIGALKWNKIYTSSNAIYFISS